MPIISPLPKHSNQKLIFLMAQSRLEKIGTILSRVSGLLRTGAMKLDDKPTWYDVYAAYPPRLKPSFDRPAPNVENKNIFFAEDTTRAKYHKTVMHYETVNLLDTSQKTSTQKFIAIYNNLKSQGALDEDQIFSASRDVLAEHSKIENVPKLPDKEVRLQHDTKNNSNAINIKSLFD